jgi:hypothetical protein
MALACGWEALLQRALVAELRHREPDLIPVLHSRVAAWFAATGDPIPRSAKPSQPPICAASPTSSGGTPIRRWTMPDLTGYAIGSVTSPSTRSARSLPLMVVAAA